MAGNQGSSFRPTNSGLAGHMGTVEILPHLLFEDKFTRVADYVQHLGLSQLHLKMFRWACKWSDIYL